MKHTLPLRLIIGALSMGAALMPARAADIAIANPSFEDQAQADGQYTPDGSAVPGWLGSGPHHPVANPRDDWFPGTTAGSSLPSPIDGLNIIGLNVGSTLYQDLTATVQPGVTYTLTMLVGHRAGVPFGAPKVTLMAGGEVLAQAVPVAPANGTFAPFTLTYNSPESGAAIGQTIRIQFQSIGTDSQPWFDNLKLTTGPNTPPPDPNIAIANHSFEEPAQADGQYTPDGSSVPGWLGSGPHHPVANPRDDWFPGTTAGSSLPSPIDGLNIVGLNTGSMMYQDLTATVQPGSTYTLTMLIGHRAGVPFGTPTVSLMAGAEVLAQAVPPAPANGAFASFTLTYDSPANGAVIGQAIRIQLQSAGVNAQAWFDNLKLTVGSTPPPPPPPPGPNIAIANHSFEEPAQADGQYTPDGSAVPGWMGSGPHHPVANPRDDWFPGTTAGSSLPSPIDGLNIIGLNVGSTLYQDLPATVQPGVTYTLTMLVGHRFGVPFGTPKVSLMAGGEVLAQAVPVAPANGTFAPFTLTYNSADGSAAVGQAIRIHFQSIGTDSQPWFDNLNLTTGPTPPPPNPNIAIANHSFEEPAQADGQYTPDGSVVPGWLGSGPHHPVANPRDDWFPGTTAGSSLPNPIDGLNIIGLNVGSTLYQDLTATVQPGVAYTLTMLVGHRAGVPFGTPTVSLMAGGEVLAEAVPSAPADGTFAPFTLTYNSPANGAAIGQVIRIQFKSIGVNAQPWFDNLALTTGPQTPPPPPPPSGPDIAIANHSFENPAQADGQYTPDGSAVPGWMGSGPHHPVANPRDDWFPGTTAGSSLPSPIDGLNIIGLNVGSTLYQDLPATVQPGVTYTLTMLVGHRIGVPFGRPTVSLMAGGQVLAEAVPLAPANGAFAPFTLTYNSPESGTAIGQTIRIQFRSIGVDSQPWFDNLKLVVGPTPPPPANAAPVAKAFVSPLFTVWPDQTNLLVVSVNGYSASAVFDGSLSSDADGDPLSFYWNLDDEGSPFANTVVATNSLMTGTHKITLLVLDGSAGDSEVLDIEVITIDAALDAIYNAVVESELERKDKRPLLATLDSVGKAFDGGHLVAGARQLHAFQQKVRAQVSGQFPGLAERLATAAGQVVAAVEEHLSTHSDSPEDSHQGNQK